MYDGTHRGVTCFAVANSPRHIPATALSTRETNIMANQLTAEEKLAQFNALLDGDINAIEDLPEYAVFEPAGYNMRGASAGINAEKGSVRFTFEKLGLIELDAKAEPSKVPVDGALFGASFYGKFGLQRIKKLFAPIMAQLGYTTIPQLVDGFENLNFVVVVSKREHEGKEYNDIVAITLAP